MPYEGRRFTPLFPRMYPLSKAREFWSDVNKTDSCTIDDSQPGVKRELYSNQKTGAEVSVITMIGNGHGFPGSDISIDGNPCTKIDGSQEIWKFFSRHRKSK